MDIQKLVSMSQEDAENILKNSLTPYVIKLTEGGKDSEILTKNHVVRARQMEDKTIELIVTRFKTEI